MTLLSPLDPWHPVPSRCASKSKTVVRGFDAPMKSDNGLTWRRDFNSVRAMFDHFDTAWGGIQGHEPVNNAEVLNHFRQSSRWAETKDLVYDGWDKGAELLQRETRAILNYTTKLVQRPEPRRDVVGEYYDIGTYMSGQPNYWIRHDPVIQRGKDRNGPIRLVIQHATSCATDEDTMLAKGALALTLATLFERAGRPTEIVAADAGYWNGKQTKYVFWSTRVKTMSQPLNYSTMSFAIAHPFMERVLYLGAGDEAKYAFKSTHFGGVMNVPLGDPSDTITLDYNPWSGNATVEHQREYIKGVLAAQGVNLTGV